MHKKLIAFVVGLGIITSSFAFAKEYEIKRSEVPEPVLKAVIGRYPRAHMNRFLREIERGKTAYEVQLDLDGAHAELIVTPTGRIRSEERTMTLADVPAAVRQGLFQSRFGKGKVLRVERVTRAENDDKPTYEIIVDLGGKKHELAFDRNGRLRSSEPADEED